MSGVRAHVGPRAAAPVAPAAVRLSRAGDVYEREADRFAETVEPEGSSRQAAAAAGSAANPVEPATSFARAVTSTPGSPLSPETRREYGDRLGHDFGEVRVHADREAAAAADAVSARAFTRGRHIFFAAGEYRPSTPAGRHLLAHELAHTRQDRGGAAAPDAIARQAVETPTTATKAGAAANAIVDILQSDPEGGVNRARAQLAGLDAITRAAALTRARALATPDLQARLAEVANAPVRTPETSDKAAGQALQPPVTVRPERPAIATTTPATTPPVPSTVTSPGTPSASGQGGTRATAEAPMAAGEAAPQAEAASAEQRAAEDAQAEQANVSKQTEGETARAEREIAANVAGAGDVPDLRARIAPLSATTGGEPGEAPQPLSSTDLSMAADETEAPSGGGPATSESIVSAGAGAAAPSLSLATREPPQPATTPTSETATPAVADIGPLIARLEAASNRADITVDSQVRSANARLSARASGLKKQVKSNVDSRVKTIRKDFSDARDGIDTSVEWAAQIQIGTALTDRQTEADTVGESNAAYFEMQCSDHRTNLDKAVTDAVTDIEGLKTEMPEIIGRLLTEYTARANANALEQAAAFPDTERGRLQRNAVSEIGTKTVAKMEEQIPVAAAASGDAFKELPDAFRAHGAQALIEFDDSVPKLLASVMAMANETGAKLIPQAAQARATLNQEAAPLKKWLTNWETEAVKQAEEITPRAEEQIDAALKASRGQVWLAGKAATNRINEVVAQAVSVLGEAEAPDPTSAEEFTTEIEAFADAAADGAGEPIAEIASGVGGLLGRALTDADTDLDKVENLARSRRVELAIAWDDALSKFVTAVDQQLGSSVEELGKVFVEMAPKIDSQIRQAIADLKTAFTATWNEAFGLRVQMIRDVHSKNKVLLLDLDRDMRWSAYEVGWAFDHPDLAKFEKVLDVIAGVLLALQALALVVLVVIIAVYAAVAALSVFMPTWLAGIIVKVGVFAWIGWNAYQVYRARRQEQGVLGAFVGTLGDVTGITQIIRGATEPHLSAFERAYDITHGAGTLVMLVFGVARRGPMKKIQSKIDAVLPKWLVNPSQNQLWRALGRVTGRGRGASGEAALGAGASPGIKPVPSIEPPPGTRPAEAPPLRVTEPVAPRAAEPIAPRGAAEPLSPRIAEPAPLPRVAEPPTVRPPETPARTPATEPAASRPTPEPSTAGAKPSEGKLLHFPPPGARPPSPARAVGETGPAAKDVIPIFRPPTPRPRPGMKPAAAPKPAEPVLAAKPEPVQLAEAAEVAVQPRLVAGGGGGRPQTMAAFITPGPAPRPGVVPLLPRRHSGTGGPAPGGSKGGSPPSSPPARGPAAPGTPPNPPPPRHLKLVRSQPEFGRGKRRPSAKEVLDPPSSLSEKIEALGKVAETGEKVTTRRKGRKPLTSRQAQSEAGRAFEPLKVAEFAQRNPSYVVFSNARFPPWMRKLWPVVGHGPDAIAINTKTTSKIIKVFDSAGSPTTRHLVKTRNYVEKIRAGLPDALKDYKVVWEERYWQFGQKTRKGPGQKTRKRK